MSRTSTFRVRSSPTRSSSPSWSTRSSLRLQLQGDLADLVEEEGAAVGQLEPAGPVAQGPGERAPGVAEELALVQLRGAPRRS